jgi:hypothetical protein
MAVLFLACFIGIPVAVVSLTESQGVIYPTLAALAVVFVIAMWLLSRSLRTPAPSARSFEVAGEPLEVRRGGEVEAGLTVYDPEEIGERLEVGLVCVERYDRAVSSRTEGGETVADRAIAEDVAYERWVPARRTEEEQIFRFRIPADAPYSYEGEFLSFAWRVSAREPARTDEGTSDDPIWVLP